MRGYCGALLFLLLLPCILPAQVVPDSIPVGVITVHRPPVKAAFRVQKSVLSDGPVMGGTSTFSDSVSVNENAPYPIYGDGGPYPIYGDGGQFSWNAVLKQTKYEFAWGDSTRADSARFIYTIDKNGKAKCESFPYESADSSGQAFQKQIFNYFVLFDRWTPARKITKIRDGAQPKTKRIPCTVIITVYAYDPYVGRLMPLGPER